MESLREWAAVIATTLLGVVAAYFSYSYGRQLKLSLASRRLEAYSKLWEATGLASPTRLDERTGLVKTTGALDRSLTESERRTLYGTLTTWYYTDGNGMLLTLLTRNLYLRAKHNLVCDDADLQPDRFRTWLEETGRIGEGTSLTWKERGCFSIRQLSLLRTQMKTDLAIYGLPFSGELEPHEVEFLIGCGVNVQKKPWSYGPRTPWWRWSPPWPSRPWRYAPRGRPRTPPSPDSWRNCGPADDPMETSPGVER